MSRSTFFTSCACLAAFLHPAVAFAQESPDKPIKAFILAGQSSMQGHAHVRTLAHLAKDDASKATLLISLISRTYR